MKDWLYEYWKPIVFNLKRLKNENSIHSRTNSKKKYKKCKSHVSQVEYYRRTPNPDNIHTYVKNKIKRIPAQFCNKQTS